MQVSVSSLLGKLEAYDLLETCGRLIIPGCVVSSGVAIQGYQRSRATGKLNKLGCGSRSSRDMNVIVSLSSSSLRSRAQWPN